jgi:hypothetical protein
MGAVSVHVVRLTLAVHEVDPARLDVRFQVRMVVVHTGVENRDQGTFAHRILPGVLGANHA